MLCKFLIVFIRIAFKKETQPKQCDLKLKVIKYKRTKNNVVEE